MPFHFFNYKKLTALSRVYRSKIRLIRNHLAQFLTILNVAAGNGIYGFLLELEERLGKVSRVRILSFCLIFAVGIQLYEVGNRETSAEEPMGRFVKIFAGKGSVVIVKSWPLNSSLETYNDRSARYPNELPQMMNFRQISSWHGQGAISKVYADSCFGVIEENYRPIHNGWSYTALENIAPASGFDRILAFIPLKLKAKYQASLDVECLESKTSLSNHNQIMDEIRAGVTTARLDTLNSPLRVKLLGLREKLLRSFKLRGEHIANKLINSSESEVVALVGTPQIEFITAKFEEAGIGYKIFEPVGFSDTASNSLRVFDIIASELAQFSRRN